MTDLLNTTQTALLDWTSKAINAGWLAPNALDHVKSVNSATPGQLFAGPDRPLVVGFFGGTGVGKSSLMNRLAGEAIARVSAERPTSTDITAYVHTSVRVDRLPSNFPMDKLRTAMHHNAAYAAVLWLDMPDFDSVETTHRELVEQWLPYIDVLVYVVSPERYRDDEGWRLLQKYGQRHAWLFVINHWDRGDPIQREDFQALLQTAGLENPLLFCTDCNPDKPAVDDDFQQFDETVRALADEQLISELEKRGVFQRLGELQKTATGLHNSLGDNDLIDRWQTQWQTHWARYTDEITQAVRWQIPNLAEHYADDSAPFWLRWLPGASQHLIKQPQSTTSHHQTLLDEAILQRMDDGIAEFVYDARAENIHTQALADDLSRRRAELPARLTQITREALQASLQKPGETWQRVLYKTLVWIANLLPLGILGWAGYKLVSGFAQSTAIGVEYLGINFAVHTAMLTGLAWLVPTMLHRKLKPSRVKAAERGLAQGLDQALAEVNEHVGSGVQKVGEIRQKLIKQLDELQTSTAPQSRQSTASDAVKRLLVG